MFVSPAMSSRVCLNSVAHHLEISDFEPRIVVVPIIFSLVLGTETILEMNHINYRNELILGSRVSVTCWPKLSLFWVPQNGGVKHWPKGIIKSTSVYSNSFILS